VDGSVIPCCGGYNGRPLGNVFKQSLEEIWNGREYQELRKCIIENKIYDGCQNCELYSFNVNEPQIEKTILDDLLICPTCGCGLEHKRIIPEFSKKYAELDVKAEDKLVKKIGNWTTAENPNALSKSLVMSNTTGDKTSYSFKGKLAVIYFLRHDWSGIAEIYVDGEFLESQDLYHDLYQYGFEYMVETEDDGEHTIDIVVTGEKNPKSIACQIWVDGFRSLPPDEIFFCETCKTKFPVIDGVVDFTRHDDEMVKEYNAFLNAGGDDAYEFDKNPEITKVGHFLKVDILDSLIQEDVSDKTVVDVGCGPWGFACIFPKLQGCKIGIGLDISLSALRESRRKLDNYYYVTSNQRVPMANNSVDIAFAGEKKYAEGNDHISLQNHKSLKRLLAGKFEIEVEQGVNLSISPSMDQRIKNKTLLKFWSRIFLNHPRYATGLIIKCRKIG
jgi:SAM-dependent methyltransferase/glutaredoxin-related protein